MLRTRCPYCGRPFSISREEAGAILAQASVEGARYGMRECPFCRRRVKIGLAELRRVAPAPAEVPAPAAEGPEAPSPAPSPEEEAAVEPAVLEGPPPVEAPAEPTRRRGRRTVKASAAEPQPARRSARKSTRKTEEAS